MLYNPELRRYDPELLDRLGLTEDQLPHLDSPREPAGGLRPGIARETGLRAGLPVSTAIHDQYCAALATGAVRAGTVMVGTGTAWVLLAVGETLPEPATDQAYVCHHVVDGLFGQILSLVNGGSALTWALELTGQSGKNSREIERMLDSVPPGSQGLRCWPLLVTSGVAGLVPGATGCLSGIQLSHGPGHLIRAVVEGLAFELNRHLGFLNAQPIRNLVLGGGAAGGQITPQILADVTGLPLTCTSAGAGSTLGAVIIARGLIEPAVSLADLAERMAPPARKVEPGADSPFYREQFQRYTLGMFGARTESVRH